ncbi:MAG: hypothetical protein DDT32_01971 [Syntrophomonadaceae bacterium]|nr:hypothetical protein [Bacillota bacterium]MBT9148201.1 hypothetical protein [Bacillota bacterium]
MNIAQASLEECRYYLILVKDLGYGDTPRLMSQLEEVSKLLEAGTLFLPGDVNGDGAVDIFDLVILGRNFGKKAP